MSKEKHERTKSMFQNDHLRMEGLTLKAETLISRLYYGPGQKWRPELGQWRQRRRSTGDLEKGMEERFPGSRLSKPEPGMSNP